MLSHWNSGICVYTVYNISNTQTAKTCSGRVWCLWRGMNEILCSQVLSLVALLYFLPNPLKGAVAKHNPVTVGKWTHGPAKCYVYNTQLQVTLMPDWKGQIFCLRRGDAVPRLHTRSSNLSWVWESTMRWENILNIWSCHCQSAVLKLNQ